MPATRYAQLLGRLAAEGFVVVGLERHALIDYPKAAEEFGLVMKWALQPGTGGLAGQMERQGLTARPDPQRLALVGQSSGNHVLGAALAQDCSAAQAWVMIDPVDGFDPFRIVKSQDLITPGKKLNFTIPSLLLNNGLDPVSANPFYPPCAPEGLSNDRFYDATPGPIWAVNATEFGHLDCLDSQGYLCPTNRSTDKDAYRAMLAESAATFLGVLFGMRPRSDLSRLEDPGLFNVSVLLKHNFNGVSREQVRPGCASIAPGEVASLLV